jgi:NADPH2:quinone reductase
MVAAIRVHKVGGPEAMVFEDVEVSAPDKGEIRVKQRACGVNFIDTYFRTGLYKAPDLPFIPGNEAAGDVTAVGEGVTDLKVGDRITYNITLGGYAAERLLPADRAIKLPAGISYEAAASMMLKGMTARYLLRKTFKVEKGTTLLMHAAAGGVGLIICQWAASLGATVIGTAGSKEKAELAKANGCHHVILYRDEDFVARVKEITGGKLCDVVYDGVGKDTFPGSLDCLRPLGMFATFGNASGPVPPVSPLMLLQRGSLFMTRPSLAHYTATRADLLDCANDLFDVVQSGAVKIPVNQTYSLKDARKAHEDLESRNTTGSSILIP